MSRGSLCGMESASLLLACIMRFLMPVGSQAQGTVSAAACTGRLAPGPVP